MTKAKRKSDKRWEQFNNIVDSIAPKLPSPTHLAALMVCFRHGRGAGYFRCSNRRLAKSIGRSDRQVTRLLDELESIGVIELVEDHQGPIPRTYRINFAFANGDTHDRVSTKPTPQANGDTHDR